MYKKINLLFGAIVFGTTIFGRNLVQSYLVQPYLGEPYLWEPYLVELRNSFIFLLYNIIYLAEQYLECNTYPKY